LHQWGRAIIAVGRSDNVTSEGKGHVVAHDKDGGNVSKALWQRLDPRHFGIRKIGNHKLAQLLSWNVLWYSLSSRTGFSWSRCPASMTSTAVYFDMVEVMDDRERKSLQGAEKRRTSVGKVKT